MNKENKIEIYESQDNSIKVNVNFDEDTVWLTQKQMALLFDRDRKTITRHISSIFKEKELDGKVVCSFFEHTTVHGAIKGKTQTKKTKIYNLDVIISVGYRVKSKQGTQFRQWATQRLKDYLVQGYAVNEKRLKQKNQEIQHLKTGIRILNRVVEDEINKNSNEMLNVFSRGLELLDNYDHEKLDAKGKTDKEVIYPDYDDYLNLIDKMYSDFKSDVFAKPKDNSFKSSINQIKQSFNGKALYPTLEEKAACLLYLIVKNHSFVDGNKRIAAVCFLYFLEQNDMLMNSQGNKIISNETLAALTLFVASSKSKEMKTIVNFIITILNRND